MLIAMIWGFLAMIMFFFRPYSMRNNSRETNTNEKPTSLLSNVIFLINKFFFIFM